MGSGLDVSSRIQVPEQRYHVDRHGELALKQLRLSVLNEMHANSYTGPRLVDRCLNFGIVLTVIDIDNNHMIDIAHYACAMTPH